MGFLGVLGMMLLFVGIVRLGTYLQRRRWPVVDGTLDLSDASSETVSAGEIVAIRPKYIYQLHYFCGGRQHVVKMTSYKMLTDRVKLRINPKKPGEAYLDRTWMFPILGVCIGIILILVSIKI